MHVLQIITYYHPHWTGLTQHARRVAEGLAARGHQVTVLTSQFRRELPRGEEINGVRVVRLPVLGRVSRGQVMPGFVTSAAALIRRHDVVQMHTPLLESLLVAALCRRWKKPLVMTHHGDLVMPSGAFNRLTERLVTAMMSRAGRMADWVTTYSDDYARHSLFLRQFASHLRAIAPPVELPRPDLAAVREWRAVLGLEDKHLVGFAGRFVEEKGFDFLLQSIPLIRERVPEAHFIFAGETEVAYENFYERQQALRQKHAAHLTFVGLLSDPQQLANFYAMCNVFALPSRTDCFALVQLEAALSGAPLVTADIPGARVVVQRTGMGRLVAPRNPEALADGIVEVLQRRDLYLKSREEIQAAFSARHSLDEYEALLADLTTCSRQTTT